MLDALRGYVQLATGLAEVTVTKAREAASTLLDQGPQVADPDAAVDAAKAAATQVQGLADGLLEASSQNREMLVGLVRTEVDRAAGRLGFVREEELAAVRRHVARLESQLGEVRDRMGASAASASAPSVSPDEAPEPPSAEEPPDESVPAEASAAAPADGATGNAAESAAGSGPAPGIPVKPRKKKIPVAPQEDA
jgi:hypothetical protein